MPTDKPRKLPARNWERYFHEANVRVEDLDACKSSRAKTIKMGLFLSPNVGREVAIEVKGRTGRAVLRVEHGRAKEKVYFFEVTWNPGPTPAPAVEEKPQPTEKAAEKPTKRKTVKSPAPTPQAGGGTPTTTKPTTQPNGGGNDEDW